MFKKWKLIKRLRSIVGLLKSIEWLISIVGGFMIGYFSKLNDILGLWLSIPISIVSFLFVCLVLTYRFLIIKEKIENGKQKLTQNTKEEKIKIPVEEIANTLSLKDCLQIAQISQVQNKYIFRIPKPFVGWQITNHNHILGIPNLLLWIYYGCRLIPKKL
jgi:hypothetical protein